MLSRALQMAKPAMQQLEGDDKSYNGIIHYLPCVFDAVQRQQQVKGCVPHSSWESERYKQEHGEIMHNLQSYTHMRITMHGHLLPISLDKYHNLVLPPDFYDSLYSPQPMAPPRITSPRKGQMAGGDDDSMTPAAAPGCTSAATRRSSFTITSMEQDDETDWDSESDKPARRNYRPASMSDYEDWAEDNIAMGDHPSCVDEPPTIGDKCIEGASSMAKAPESTTHPPDPMHLSTREGSPHTEDDKDVDRPASKGGDADDNSGEEEEGPPADDVIVEEYYKQQEEELDYEDDAPNEECKQVVEVNESKQATDMEEKQPTVRLGNPVNKRASTDIETGEAASLMESVLGIQSPEGGRHTDEEHVTSHSHRSNRQHTVLSDDNR